MGTLVGDLMNESNEKNEGMSKSKECNITLHTTPRRTPPTSHAPHAPCPQPQTHASALCRHQIPANNPFNEIDRPQEVEADRSPAPKP